MDFTPSTLFILNKYKLILIKFKDYAILNTENMTIEEKIKERIKLLENKNIDTAIEYIKISNQSDEKKQSLKQSYLSLEFAIKVLNKLLED